MREAPENVTYQAILRFFLPLALTLVLLATTVPLLHAGLNRLAYGAGTGLAAFTLARFLAEFTHGPLYLLQETATRYALIPGGLRRVAGLSLVSAGAVTAVNLALVASGAADFIFARLMKAEPSIVPLASETFLVLALCPAPLALSLVARGLFVARRRTKFNALAVSGNLAAVFVVLFPGADWGDFNPAVRAALAFSLGNLAEGTILALSHRDGEEPPAGPAPAPPSWKSLLGFVMPLFLANALMMLSGPLLGRITQSVGQGRAAAGAFGVVRSVSRFVTNGTVGFMSLALVLARGPAEWRRLWKFMLAFAAGLALLLLAMVFTPLGELVLGRWLALDRDPEALALALPALLPAAALPFVIGGRSLLRGLFMRAGKTRLIPLGSGAYVVALVVTALVAFRFAPGNGAWLAVAAWAAAMALDVAVMAVGLARRGLGPVFRAGKGEAN